MNNYNCNSKPYTIIGAGEIEVDNLASVPDFFLGIRTLEDESTGNTIYAPVRVPGARVMPTGNLANVVALDKNNDSLVVPDNQVRAGYIDPQAGGAIMRYAGATHPAEFLMLGDYTNGKMLIQSTGFLTIPGGHQYIVSSQYFTGENGEPTADNASGQKLFIPLSDTILLVNGDF